MIIINIEDISEFYCKSDVFLTRNSTTSNDEKEDVASRHIKLYFKWWSQNYYFKLKIAVLRIS